jgi:GT2 family glycosyltransferase
MAPDADRGEPERPIAGERPAVSVVMPFAGSAAQGDAAVAALLTIERQPGDEIVVVDNSGTGHVSAHEAIRVLAADEERSAYYARNAGAEQARNEWLLFMDADCRPNPDILDRYFEPPLEDDIGAAVGEVAPDPAQTELVARYARARGHLQQLAHFSSSGRPFGVTANMLVRREAWESVGGFLEGVRSGGDTEFSWRLQTAGWKLAYRPDAVVEHRHRDSLRKLLRVAARYGAGRAWLRRRYGEAVDHPRLLPELVRSVAGVVVFGLTGRFERAAFKALDGMYVASGRLANLLSNTPDTAAPSAVVPRAAIAGAFPALDDPAPLERVRQLSPGAAVEARERPVRVNRGAARELPIAWAEDDGWLRRAGAVIWLAGRRPLRVAGYALSRRRTRPALTAVAARARRLVALGVREIEAVDPGASADAEALAALTGARRVR